MQFRCKKILSLQSLNRPSKNTSSMKDAVVQKLDEMNLRRTAVRKEVLRLFFEARGKALSSRDIEAALENPDRITLYRTLKTFEQKGLIHQAVDGTGTAKYALCSGNCSTHAHHDEHAHFHCLVCGKTICLDDQLELQAKAPKGYKVKHAHLVLEGECAACAE
jgi:Fur family transcriptional regulator, ferric uptake regulator